MTQQGLVFVDRRKGGDRRLDADPCQHLPLDLYHRMRRKKSDRRSTQRSLSEDYYAFIEATIGSAACSGSVHNNDTAMGSC